MSVYSRHLFPQTSQAFLQIACLWNYSDQKIAYLTLTKAGDAHRCFALSKKTALEIIWDYFLEI